MKSVTFKIKVLFTEDCHKTLYRETERGYIYPKTSNSTR